MEAFEPLERKHELRRTFFKIQNKTSFSKIIRKKISDLAKQLKLGELYNE